MGAFTAHRVCTVKTASASHRSEQEMILITFPEDTFWQSSWKHCNTTKQYVNNRAGNETHVKTAQGQQTVCEPKLPAIIMIIKKCDKRLC